MADKKKVDDAVFEVLMKQAFEMYAEKIENEPEPEFSEEALAMAEARKDKIYKDLMKQIDREERKKKWSYKRIIVLAAAISVFIVVLVLNASAVKNFFVTTYMQIQGDVLKVSVDYDKFNEKYSEIRDFRFKEDIIVPSWLPNDTELIRVKDSSVYVYFEYKHNDKYLDITEEFVDNSDNTEELQLENNGYFVNDVVVMGYDAKLITIKYESDITDYAVIWNIDNIQYKINSNFNKTELDIVLKNLIYYKNTK